MVATGPVISTYCPMGSDPNGAPSICMIDFDWASSKLGLTVLEDESRRVSGSIVVRVQKMPTTAPVGPSEQQVTLSLGSGANSDCSTFGYSTVQISVTFAPSSDPTACTPLGEAKALVATYDQSDISVCGKCDVPVVCNIWDAVIGNEKDAATNFWNKAILMRLAQVGDKASCLKQ
jgi:hypothetical protein